MGDFKKVVLVGVCVLFVISCEQPDGEADFINTNEQAGFMSTTGNSDTFIEEDKLETIQPLLHMSFDGNLIEEEASAKFDKAVAEYLAENNTLNKGVSTEWVYRIATLTGTQSDNDTDGEVRASVYFGTDKGVHYVKNVVLNNPGDDREKGKWDYYLFKTSLPGQAVSSVEIKAISIQLKGTDGWFIKQYHTYMVASDQTVAASGATNIYTFPNVWLDNTCANCWDTYRKRGGYGKLKF